MKAGLFVNHVRTLAAITVAVLILGAAAAAAGVGGRGSAGATPDGWRGVLGGAAGHALAAMAATVDGIAAGREARRAYRRDPSYVPPFPAPYYPYPNGYPYW
jgi:hypothetical protein